MSADERAATVREIVARPSPGGRVVLSARGRRRHRRASLARRPSRPRWHRAARRTTLEVNGFGIVRTLAERDGLVFVEGIKPRAKG